MTRDMWREQKLRGGVSDRGEVNGQSTNEGEGGRGGGASGRQKIKDLLTDMLHGAVEVNVVN